MQIASITIAELGPTIARLCRSHKFLCAIEHLGKVAVYASSESAVDALLEARTDYPKGTVAGEYEFLTNDAIAALLRSAADPASAGMKHLGEITPN